MITLRRLFFKSLTLIFAVGIMYLLFWPSSSTPSTSTSSSTLSTKGGDTRNVLSKWMELSVSVNREGINTSPSRHAAQTDDSTYYLIFDAIQHKGSLKFLDRLSTKWKIIVVNSAESCKRCEIGGKTLIQMFLASDESSSTWEHVPRYMREKMAAISYALSHSADWLYVTDSQFLPEEDTLLSVCSHKTRTAPVYSGPGLVFEPCEHFMDPYTWHDLHPPGSPQGLYNVKVVSMDAIHMVVDNCHKEHMDSLSWKRGLDTQAARPYTMAGTFSSTNFRNVLVSRNMAWSLVASLPLPVAQSSPLARQNVLLNLMVQRMVWETSGVIGFLPSVQSSATPACPSCEVNATIHKIGLDHLYKLSQWRCNSSKNLMQCLLQLSDDISGDLFSNSAALTPEIHALLRAWGHIFYAHRFLTATRIPLNEHRLSERAEGVRAQLTAAKSMHVIAPTVSLPPNAFAELCKPPDGRQYGLQIPPHHPVTDILLLIIFNYPQLVVNIPLLEYLYGRHFEHILYCSSSMEHFQNLYATKHPDTPVSFVEIPDLNGYFGYSCMSAASKIGFQVVGYLHISDDVILNAWNLYLLPRGMPWFQKSLRVASVYSKEIPDVWTDKRWAPWTNNLFGKLAAVRVYERLQKLREEPGIGKKVSALLENLQTVSGCDRCLMYEVSDIFYLPVEMAKEFAFFADIFRESNVHLEVAVPTILAGLVSESEIHRLRGSYLWYEDRERYPFVYTEYDHFLHPWKFSRLKDPSHKSFFCREVLSRMDRDVMTHKVTSRHGQ